MVLYLTRTKAYDLDLNNYSCFMIYFLGIAKSPIFC